MITLPYLLRGENIARVEHGALLIGDRRVFPFRREFVACHNAQEIAQAIKDMVTQGGGPLEVALQALPYLARKSASFSALESDMGKIIQARPTNTTMKRTVLSLLSQEKGDADYADKLQTLVARTLDQFQQDYLAMGKLGASLLPQDAKVLTTCFAEHSLCSTLQFAREQGKQVSVLVNETRPYLQGARLTAPSLKELGFDVRLITDGAGAACMAEGLVNIYLTACDLVCADRSVANKTGTLPNAIAASYHHIPYVVFAVSPDPTKRTMEEMVVEWRDGKEVTHCMGQPVTDPSVEGLYPAFDRIPGSLVTHIVTPEGII
ncbi:MAG: translation initiation factor 2 [Sphaerochaeta sp.]|jgi:methylthioribose-1-phosphate isomerase|nr:translation initiation factor 2 [Sphaerochaeta sp.]MCH3920993.1 translation initiation factor 2 [Sphaerochaeta sp.]MCI2045249.1 translation initiation factor 2 [Sphaerochaeta sp.]MCI2075876.1 translation initiation factor 2 [Sphaerochaeta sp.]MCI2097142.1 translation initiation factor 2 [Sphaerochaeta sp.]